MKLYSLTTMLAMSIASGNYTDHTSYAKRETQYACGDMPELNKKILEFVKGNMNKTIGKGECWDLAAAALNSTGAIWDGNYRFGKELVIKKDCLYPGDVIQFENVELSYTRGSKSYREKMAKHTAIIYEIKGDEDFIMADQNTNIHGRRVGLSPVNLKDIKKGKYTVYQPVAK